MKEAESKSAKSLNEIVFFKITSLYQQQITFYAAWTTTFVAITGAWQQGYSIGSINAAFGPITGAMREFYEVGSIITLYLILNITVR